MQINNFGEALGPVRRPTPEQRANIRANIRARALNADDAALLISMLEDDR